MTGAAAGVVPPGLVTTGCGAVAGVLETIVVIVPFTSFFCFVDDVGIG